MQGREFLATAARLLGSPPESVSPADGRTAAGRAYYALFLELLSLLEEAGVSPTRKGFDHEWLRRTVEIIGATDDAVRRVADDPTRLRTHRVQADYRLDVGGFHFNRRNVDRLYQRATRALERVEVRKDALLASLPAAAAQALTELRPPPSTPDHS